MADTPSFFRLYFVVQYVLDPLIFHLEYLHKNEHKRLQKN